MSTNAGLGRSEFGQGSRTSAGEQKKPSQKPSSQLERCSLKVAIRGG